MRQASLLLFSKLVMFLQLDLILKMAFGFHNIIEPNHRFFGIQKTRRNMSAGAFSLHGARKRNLSSSLILKNKEDGEGSEEAEELTLFRGSGDDDPFTKDVWEDIETGQPPKWMVVKELLGISAITYVLAAAIVISLGLNFFLGPGWLGQALGLSGTGSFTETSGSIPESLDLSDPAYLL